MKTIVLIALIATGIAMGDEPIQGVCVDGDMERAFTVSAPLPRNAVEGGYLPQVDYAEDGTTPKAITWKESSKTRPVATRIGRYKGYEIIDLTFPVDSGSKAPSDQPFEARILAFRVGTAATSPLLPFFVIMGDQARWYEQVFTSDDTDPFCLEVSRTIPGKGGMWAEFTFGFSDSGGVIKEMRSGGRGLKMTVTKFKHDGTVISTKKLE